MSGTKTRKRLSHLRESANLNLFILENIQNTFLLMPRTLTRLFCFFLSSGKVEWTSCKPNKQTLQFESIVCQWHKQIASYWGGLIDGPSSLRHVFCFCSPVPVIASFKSNFDSRSFRDWTSSSHEILSSWINIQTAPTWRVARMLKRPDDAELKTNHRDTRFLLAKMRCN